MSAQLAPTAVQHFVDNNGFPLFLGTLSTFIAGTNTPQATYVDSTLTTQNTNPTPLNFRGECNLWLDPSKAYKFVLKDAFGNLIWTVDNITIGNANPSYNIIPAVDNLYTLGNTSFAWANVYVGANHAPVLDTVSGNIGYYARTAAEIAASVTPTNFVYAPGDVRRYGAKGDGVTDDTNSLISAHKVGDTVIYPGTGFTFLISALIPLAVAGQVVNGNGSTIKFAASFNDAGTNILIALNVTVTDVEVNSLIFDGSANSGKTVQNCFVGFQSTASRGRVRNCRGLSLATIAGFNCAFAFFQGANECEADNCTALSCPGMVFTQGARTRITSCAAIDPKDVSIALNSQSCTGSSVLGCKIYNNNGTTVSGHITAEDGASDWIISDNYISGVVNGVGLGALSVSVFVAVTGGIISNNVIDGRGLTCAAPSALISISNFYSTCQIYGNVLKGMPAGLANNVAVSIPALQTRFQNNRIDATAGASAATVVLITIPASGPSFCDIFDNWINNTGNSRIFTLGSGNAGGNRMYFKGGSFIGGSIGIDTALSAPSNCAIFIENILESTVTTNLYNPSVADSISFFFQTNLAWKWPHSIKDHRSIYGSAIPTQGTWAVSDIVYNSGAVVAGTFAWVCTTAGSPGTFSPVSMP